MRHVAERPGRSVRRWLWWSAGSLNNFAVLCLMLVYLGRILPRSVGRSLKKFALRWVYLLICWIQTFLIYVGDRLAMQASSSRDLSTSAQEAMQLCPSRSLHQCKTIFGAWCGLSWQLVFSPDIFGACCGFFLTSLCSGSWDQVLEGAVWEVLGGASWKVPTSARGEVLAGKCPLGKGCILKRIAQVPHQKCRNEPREHCTQKTVS